MSRSPNNCRTLFCQCIAILDNELVFLLKLGKCVLIFHPFCQWNANKINRSNPNGLQRALRPFGIDLKYLQFTKSI